MTAKAISQELTELGQNELRDLRARIDFLLQGRGPTEHNGNGHKLEDGTEEPSLMLLGVILGLCRERGLESRPLGRLAASQGYPAFAEKVPEVLASLGAESLNTSQLRCVLRLGLGLVLDQLQEMGVPASASTLMNHIHRIPGVLDTNFPGYRQAGLLKLLARNEHE